MNHNEAPPSAPCGAKSCQCATPAASANPVLPETKPSRRGFLKASGAVLSVSSLMGTAALMAKSDDVKATVEWAEHFQGNYRRVRPRYHPQ